MAEATTQDIRSELELLLPDRQRASAIESQVVKHLEDHETLDRKTEEMLGLIEKKLIKQHAEVTKMRQRAARDRHIGMAAMLYAIVFAYNATSSIAVLIMSVLVFAGLFTFAATHSDRFMDF